MMVGVSLCLDQHLNDSSIALLRDNVDWSLAILLMGGGDKWYVVGVELSTMRCKKVEEENCLGESKSTSTMVPTHSLNTLHM